MTSDNTSKANSKESYADALRRLTGNTRLEMKLYSHSLALASWNNKAVFESFSELVRKHHKVRVLIIVRQPKLLVQADHCLLRLFRKLPDRMSIKAIAPEYDILPEQEFAINDAGQILYKRDWQAHEFSERDTRDNLVLEKESQFNEAWKHAHHDSQLRELNI